MPHLDMTQEEQASLHNDHRVLRLRVMQALEGHTLRATDLAQLESTELARLLQVVYG